jgi:hypothetical protein
MTKQIENWRLLIINWLERKELEQITKNLESRKKGVIYNLTNDLSVEESIVMFKSVSESFLTLMREKLEKTNNEKSAIEKFLNKLK